MTDMTYQEAEDFFAVFYRGKHHIPAKIKEYGPGWIINHHGDLSTFDFNDLTRLVFMAHEECVRVSIHQGGPRAVGIAIWKRDPFGNKISTRHSTIDDAIKTWNKEKGRS